MLLLRVSPGVVIPITGWKFTKLEQPESDGGESISQDGIFSRREGVNVHFITGEINLSLLRNLEWTFTSFLPDSQPPTLQKNIKIIIITSCSCFHPSVCLSIRQSTRIVHPAQKGGWQEAGPSGLSFLSWLTSARSLNTHHVSIRSEFFWSVAQKHNEGGKSWIEPGRKSWRRSSGGKGNRVSRMSRRWRLIR